MISGMTLSVFIHVVLSLIGIVAGLIALLGLMASRWMPQMTAVFLVTTVLTSVTGFFLPAPKLLPSHIVGIISLVVLAIALFALYTRRMAGIWRPVYIATAAIALYLNVFVLVIQGFLKVAPLKALAPTQTELPFVAAQAAVLVFFVVSGFLAIRRFQQ